MGINALRSLAFASVLALTLVFAPASASATDPIEGVWSFNGGEVAVKSRANGALFGTVVAPTKFSDCFHPIGEKVWTGMNRQADGSYWGDHQWYFETAECIANPAPGLTAWRVLRIDGGSRFLRVCFSEPGSALQPKIAANGSTTGATFGCTDSALVSALPEIRASNVEDYIKLPPNDSCFGRARMKVRLLDPAGDPFAKIVVKLKSGSVQRQAKLKRVKGTVTATLRLKGLTAATFTVRVRATTVLGQHLKAKRTYRRCGANSPRRSHRAAIHA